ncbi:mucin-17-like isoform X3 [Zerene cesonia]|uniref:mucin-17-like isoform X3 n=1 Tax=Zerene cesonia TaxID=33412 RepID=UPI0018E557C7|nr:mucin-17-like isoform X3 [Zerene cesonia]
MRAGVWWGAIALTLLLVASNAIRTVQGEGTSRVSRRPTTTDRSSSNINRAEDYQPTFRPRGIRRREESPEPITPRSRSRSRLPEKENVVAQIDVTQAQQSRPNEQFESRRSNSRTRTRPTEITATSEKTLSRENVIRARSRQSGRRNSPTPLSQTQATVTLSSRSVDTKQDASNVKLDEISKPIPTAETIPANQFRRRSSTVSTLEETKPARSRGRYDSRINTSSLDLEVSGTTNTFTATAKEQSVLRENDLRNSRKLRYKTRTSETDTNLTGDGIVATNEVIKSSQKNDLTSQRETKSPSSSTTERVSSSTGTLKSMKVVRRPISRGTSTKSVVVKNKSKVSDEISEDDNYPESFKALIQAKNATQPNSPSSESLSVKASQVSKTYASPTQSIITGPGTDKNSRLRKKVKLEENSDTDQNKIGTIATTTILTTTTSTTSSTTTTSTTTEQSKSRSSAYRPRGSYLPRNKKVNSTPSDISSTSASPSTERQYKFSRKFKSVTNAPNTDVVLKTKRVDNSITKKPVIRSSLFSRKNDPPNNATVIPLNENRKRDRVQSANYFKVRRTLPSTSYYSRQRNNISSTTETNTVVDTETAIADKKTENSNDLPLIFTYLNNPPKSTNKHNESEKFSRENSTENEIINKAEESENKIIVNTEVTTQKYHANYKGDTEPNQKSVTSATPAIRNIQTRKYGRKPIKTRDQALNSSPVIFKTKERNVRKYSDTFSKTTEAPGNSIQPEPEKPKNKFSSKYRASYLDKPFYKPTVPTVTPSTEQGEEIQLGPELNAIAITKTRRPLTSADLRLSESLTKPLQVLNVEASQHSPSVTVSIFDALAEILTSTPKPRISTTTEVLPKQTTDSNVKQTLNGVSNNVNVNSGTGFASKETVTSKDNLNTNAMFVQTTEQNKQIVFNSMPVGENVTPSLKAEDEKTISVTPPQTTSTPPPTTPLSARKPFAIRVLYSETETPIDRMTTAASTTNVLSTDKPTMVYNSISDLLLSNNGLVSSGLTSMLSSNIRSIIEGMDEESKSRLSVGMTNLLNTLNPDAFSRVPIVDDSSPPNTTPYSLEDIKDTANINIINEPSDDTNNVLQSVDIEKIVNSTEMLDNSQMVNTESSVSVNTIQPTEITETTVFASDTETSIIDTTIRQDLQVSTSTIKTTELFISESGSSTITNNDIIPENSTEDPVNNLKSVLSSTNSPKEDVIPIELNSLREDSLDTQLQSPVSSIQLSLNESDEANDLQDPGQVSQLQLWVLSKKARVLKMIEDLLRDHNNEISNPPFNNLINRKNSSSALMSSRLTEIMNTMTLTTVTSDTDKIETSSTTFPNDFLNPTTKSITTSPSTVPLETTTTNNAFIATTLINDDPLTNTIKTDESTLETASNVADAFTNDISIMSATLSTSQDETTTEAVKEKENDNLETVPSSTTSDYDLTTKIETETTTILRTTTLDEPDNTTPSGIETATTTVTNDIKSNDIITVSNQQNFATQSTIPKKDFVIFGILPNNTVVRKDPNDNPLEALTEASPYIIYGVLPNNTIIRKFPNGTRVPQIMQKIDVLPISPWSLKNPYSPIHNIPAIVRPQSNPIRVSTNTVISKDTSNNEKENRLTIDTVNNLQVMIPSSALNIKDSSSLGITTSTQPPAEKSTASHVLSLRTTTMLPSVDEILLNSISLATKEEMVISSMTSSTPETRILTLDIDPETKQIRTEKPDDANGNTVFKFIPIEDVTVASTQESNVLKLASPKIPKLTTVNNLQTTTILSTTEINTQTPQLQMNTESNNEITTTVQTSVGTPFELSTETVRDEPPTPVFMDEPLVTTETQVTTLAETTLVSSVTSDAPATAELSNFNPTPSSILSDGSTTETTTVTTETSYMPTTLPISTFRVPTATSVASATNIVYQMQTERNPKNIGGFENAKILENQQQENAKLLQALLLAMGQKPASKVNSNAITKVQTTTVRSIEEDIRQFEEDTKLLKALLQATGRDPTSLNIPSLGDVKSILTTTPAIATTTFKTSTTPITTTQSVPPTTQASIVKSTTSSINNDIKQLQEDTKLLQALLQATSNRNVDNNKPIISGITSNVRIASNPLTTSMGSNPTTSFNPTTEDIGISTTFQPINKIMSTTTPNSRITITTEIPSSSTYSDEEDLLFLQNLKSVLNTNNKNEDPETALANRVIALAVERSLNEIQQGKSVGTTEVMTTTTPKPTTTTRTTTTRITTTPRQNMLSIEDDIKQFEQDTKLLQALLKATGQDPSKFNIPTLPTVTTTVSVNNPPSVDDDLKLLSNLLASPSPLNEPFDPLTQRPAAIQSNKGIPPTTSIKPQNIKIAVKDDLKNEQDDAKLLQTLIKLQDAQETTTVRSKLAITGHDPDEALKKLIQKTQPAGMMSEATKSSISLSTEYGNSNDALLAALLKEQGFGPTTASSLDEQLRLAALLNQVVVTPKARRTTTPPPPPPAPRRPILDGLAWLWQQWRETGPGPGGSRPSRPASVRQPTPSQATSSRVNWFGSGPFVGNADEGPPANRIPLEPPSAVEQGPGRGQLVSAAINVTRAFSQFLGAAIQGAAQTVQSVFRAGQKAASDMYTNGSGGSG